MSLDGCIGLPGPRPLKLSDAQDLRRVQELRASCDAILVGAGTVLADDPKLTVRWELLGRRGKSPLRVVLDAHLRTPPTSQVLRGEAPTLIFHGRHGGALPGDAQLATVPVDRHGFLELPAVLQELQRRRVSRLLVEGGRTVISEFLRQRLVDEFTLYIAPRVVGMPDAPRLFVGEPPETLGLAITAVSRLGEGVLLRLRRT